MHSDAVPAEHRIHIPDAAPTAAVPGTGWKNGEPAVERSMDQDI